MKKYSIVILFVAFSILLPMRVYSEEEVVKVNVTSPYIVDEKKSQQEEKKETDTGVQEIRVRLLEDVAKTKWLCELFMLKLVDEGVPEAFEELRPYFAVSDTEFSMLEMQAYKQMETIQPRFGNIVGYTLVKEEQITDVALKYTYVLKLERHAIRWLFYFYKPDDKWMFNEFFVDDKLRELFE